MKYKVTLVIIDKAKPEDAESYPIEDFFESEVFPQMEDMDFEIESKTFEKI